MRAIVGFVVLQGVLTVTGIGLLRGFRLIAPGWRAVPAAFGAALLLGTTSVTMVLCVLLVLGVPFGLGTALLVAIVLTAASWRRTPPANSSSRPAFRGRVWERALGALLAGGFAAYGFVSLMGLPTIEDDARIWSLKGIALSYYADLRPEIFLNPGTVDTHPVYPLLQPALEALFNRAMGQPELRMFHAELWLLLVAAVWTAAYLLWWRMGRRLVEQSAIALLVLLVTTPFVINSISTGYADVTGGMLLGLATLCLGMWLQDGETPGHLWLGAVLLAAAANTKDEETVGAVLVLIALAVIVALGKDRRRLKSLAGAAIAFGLLVAPWRIWTAAHGLTDSVQPPLPKALSPSFIVHRFPNLRLVATPIIGNVVTNWGWQVSIFFAVCVLTLILGPARRLATFYLLSFALLVASLLWLYTTTSVSLPFLILTAVYRTVDVFMLMTPFVSAHLLTTLLASTHSAPLLVTVDGGADHGGGRGGVGAGDRGQRLGPGVAGLAPRGRARGPR